MKGENTMEFKVGDRVKFLEGHGLLRKETFGKIVFIGKCTVGLKSNSALRIPLKLTRDIFFKRICISLFFFVI